MERTRSGRRGQPVTSATDSSVVLSRPGVHRLGRSISQLRKPARLADFALLQAACAATNSRWCYRDAGTSARSGRLPGASHSPSAVKALAFLRIPRRPPIRSRPTRWAPNRNSSRRSASTRSGLGRYPATLGLHQGRITGPGRPSQPVEVHRVRCTGELVDLLFASRARKVSSVYINNTVIPMSAARPAPRGRRARKHHRSLGTLNGRQPGLQR